LTHSAVCAKIFFRFPSVFFVAKKSKMFPKLYEVRFLSVCCE